MARNEGRLADAVGAGDEQGIARRNLEREPLVNDTGAPEDGQRLRLENHEANGRPMRGLKLGRPRVTRSRRGPLRSLKTASHIERNGFRTAPVPKALSGPARKRGRRR